MISSFKYILNTVSSENMSLKKLQHNYQQLNICVNYHIYNLPTIRDPQQSQSLLTVDVRRSQPSIFNLGEVGNPTRGP